MIRVFIFMLIFAAFPSFAGQKENVKTLEWTDSLSKEALAMATSARTFGDPNAPLQMHEYSSLSCGHCANFYNDAFPEIKSKYIDTGKVFFTAHDLPTSKSALDGAMISRCVDESKYDDFIADLFKTQRDWAFNKGYKSQLSEKARAAGLDDGQINNCLSSQKLKDWIIEEAEGAGKTFGIRSTPSFVIGHLTVIRGNVPLPDFEKAIDSALESLADSPQ